MPEFLKLKKRKDFVRIAKSGHSFATHSIVLQGDANPSDAEAVTRVGYTTTKKIGSAVVRNRCRRRLRAAVAQILPELGMKGTDYVLIARYCTADVEFASICRDLRYGIKKINFILQEKKIENAKEVVSAAVSVAD